MIIIGIEDNEVAFLTDLDAADAVRTVQGGCTVQSKGVMASSMLIFM